jgi:hypothetical protein
MRHASIAAKIQMPSSTTCLKPSSAFSNCSMSQYRGLQRTCRANPPYPPAHCSGFRSRGVLGCTVIVKSQSRHFQVVDWNGRVRADGQPRIAQCRFLQISGGDLFIYVLMCGSWGHGTAGSHDEQRPPWTE